MWQQFELNNEYIEDILNAFLLKNVFFTRIFFTSGELVTERGNK